MTWNYRVVRQPMSQPNTFHYSIQEVYYDEDGNIEFISECEITPYGETLDELLSDYARMAEAFKKPVIDYNTLEEIEI